MHSFFHQFTWYSLLLAGLLTVVAGIRLVAPRLEVGYELATKRLMSYKGVSNLLDQNRDLQDVVITYRYDNRSQGGGRLN